MLHQIFTKDFGRKRLQALLAIFFLLLALPIGLLISHAYSQLKWEAFHQYRTMAEELTMRIDAKLINLVNETEALTFADYSFFVVSGDSNANYLHRSRLAAYPIVENWPGLSGYFQINPQGEFSTPLLPVEEINPGSLGLSENEYTRRQQQAKELRSILAVNSLIKPDNLVLDEFLQRQLAVENVTSGQLSALIGQEDADSTSGRAQSERIEKLQDKIYGYKEDAKKELSRETPPVSQEAFDSLGQQQSSLSKTLKNNRAEQLGETDAVNAPSSSQLSQLSRNTAYEKKSIEQKRKTSPSESESVPGASIRQSRREKTLLPTDTAGLDRSSTTLLDSESGLRIKSFESELEPLEFSLLDHGKMVLFRKVWRENERYIQGMLIDQSAFIQQIIDQEYRNTALSDMSDLIVASQNEILHQAIGGSRRYSSLTRESASADFNGMLLYRNRLSAPFDALELAFSVKRLPPGPGAQVLVWVTLLLASVLIGGFYALYRAGLSQLALAEQQRDFVSAVSHELKTPITSIRMYGEMLKEGWADENKKQEYYQFIHDESERLTRLIFNVLQLANISRADPALKLEPIGVNVLIDTVKSKVSNQIQQAGFEFNIHCDIETGESTLMIDQDCFTQIIINLVDNAIKFSGESARIDFAATTTSNDQVLFSVRDYGQGIDSDQMKSIFKMFYRSESELTRETVGTGIGLAIVHQLTQAMGGKVDVMNRKPGAEFRVLLPKAPDA